MMFAGNEVIHRSGIAVSGAMAIATPVYPETLPP